MTSPEPTEPREGHSWDSNECCRCHAQGSVWNEHCKENREMSCPVPITWVCVNCGQHVCINCILTIPDSVPREIYTPTYCSNTCRDAWRLVRKLAGEMRYDTEDDGDY